MIRIIYISLFVALNVSSFGQNTITTPLLSGSNAPIKHERLITGTRAFSTSHADYIAYSASDASFNDFRDLTKHLAKQCKNEFETVRSIYTWISSNIDYNELEYNRNEQSAIEVWTNRKAVCEGYANLFNAMCGAVGVESRMIKGYVRNDDGSPLTFPNHAWNSVLIGGEWHLLDVTWASINLPSEDGNESIKNQKRDYFFLVDPGRMILTHLPEDPFWQLQTSTVLLGTFEQGEEVVANYLRSTSNLDKTDFAVLISDYEALDSLDQSIAYLERMVENGNNTAREYGLGIAYYYKARNILRQHCDKETLNKKDLKIEARRYFQKSLEYLSFLKEDDIGYGFSQDLAKSVIFRMEVLQ